MVDEEETTPEEIEAESSEEEDTSKEDFSFSPFDEIQEEFNPGPVPKVTGADGLPMQVYAMSGETDIPELSPDTLLCMGDYTFFESGGDLFTLEQVERRGNGWVLKDHPHIPVKPKREPCVHYVRQILQSDLNPQIKIVSRLCSARRDRQGAFMSVRDRAVYACDMREPKDWSSVEALDAFDREKIRQGKHREFFPMFKEGKKNGNE
jgi:hypothetical protein